MPDLSSPAGVMYELSGIANELGLKQNNFEDAARRWHKAKRQVAIEQAKALLTATEPSVTEKKARSVIAAEAVEDADSEAEYVALKARIDVLQLRASICQSLLRAQSQN